MKTTMSHQFGPQMSRRTLLGLGAGLAAATTLSACAGASTTGGGGDGSFTFVSTQFSPVEERQRFEQVLSTYVTDPRASFMSMPTADLTTQLRSQVDAGQLQIGLVGALHGDLTPLSDYLEDLDGLVETARGAGITDDLLTLGTLGGSTQKYIPWIQASYVVAVHRSALEWLPSGADVQSLTYDQFLQWAADAHQANGRPVFGMPAGPKGLYHRFFQGYLLPSFTGGVITQFTSSEAVEGWRWMQEFWSHCNPASTNYDNMQEPLARGEVLVAWDHVARLVEAPRENPDDWMMVPAPTGPAGLGYMLIVGGMAVPRGGDVAQATKVIQALSQPAAQIELLRQNAFFPVVEAELPADLPAPVRMQADAVAAQQSADKAILALPPIGLGERDGEMSQVFKDCFREICLQNADPQGVVTRYGDSIQTILDAAQVPCWAPDPAADVCKVG